MSGFEQVLKGAKALDIALETSSDAVDYLCFTKYLDETSSWFLGVSDGATLYTVKLSEQDVQARSGTRDHGTYLTEVGSTMREGRVELVFASAEQLTLRAKCPTGHEEFFLNKVSADDAKKDLKTLLFALSRRLNTATTQLTDCIQELEQVRKKMGAEQPVFADVTMRSAASKAVTRPKKPVGHSLVNPSAKRRKAATGVVFGSQES